VYLLNAAPSSSPYRYYSCARSFKTCACALQGRPCACPGRPQGSSLRCPLRKREQNSRFRPHRGLTSPDEASGIRPKLRLSCRQIEAHRPVLLLRCVRSLISVHYFCLRLPKQQTHPILRSLGVNRLDGFQESHLSSPERKTAEALGQGRGQGWSPYLTVEVVGDSPRCPESVCVRTQRLRGCGCLMHWRGGRGFSRLDSASPPLVEPKGAINSSLLLPRILKIRKGSRSNSSPSR